MLIGTSTVNGSFHTTNFLRPPAGVAHLLGSSQLRATPRDGWWASPRDGWWASLRFATGVVGFFCGKTAFWGKITVLGLMQLDGLVFGEVLKWIGKVWLPNMMWIDVVLNWRNYPPAWGLINRVPPWKANVDVSVTCQKCFWRENITPKNTVKPLSHQGFQNY